MRCASRRAVSGASLVSGVGWLFFFFQILLPKLTELWNWGSCPCPQLPLPAV